MPEGNFLHDIKNKLIRMDAKGKNFLSLLIDHFEHDQNLSLTQ